MKKGLVLTVLLAIVPVLGFTQTWTASNTATWIEAVGGIRGGGNNKEYTITVTGNINVPGSTDSTFGSVTGITVTIEGSGTLSPSANGAVLNIGNEQTVIVRNVTLRGRSTNNPNSVVDIGGGIFRMEGKASVTGNVGSGGVWIDGEGTFIMKDSASVSGNTRNNNSEGGGGVTVNNGTFIMQDNSQISGNTYLSRGERYGGGGVYINGTYGKNSTFTMEGGTISGNTSSNNYVGSAAGVYVKYGTFTMKGGAISGHAPIKDDANSSGTGVAVDYGRFTMEGGAISDNTGTGVYIKERAAFTMKGGVISTNKGGGVNLYHGNFTMEDGTISGNTADDGGGVSVSYESNFTMKGGAISGNKANEGGGVCVYPGITAGSSFTMQGGVISGNSAVRGGGVYIGQNDYRIATFTKTGGTIYGDDAEQNLKNTALSRIGSAVYDEKNGSWRNAGAGAAMNTDTYGFWMNDGDVVIFPSGFAGEWKRYNFDNKLTLTENTVKSSSQNFYWILQRISGNAYTLKRTDAANTITLTIRLDDRSLVISGDSGSGENNWNGTWW